VLYLFRDPTCVAHVYADAYANGVCVCKCMHILSASASTCMAAWHRTNLTSKSLTGKAAQVLDLKGRASTRSTRPQLLVGCWDSQRCLTPPANLWMQADKPTSEQVMQEIRNNMKTTWNNKKKNYGTTWCSRLDDLFLGWKWSTHRTRCCFQVAW
jgi:hypothetical protein